MLALIQRRYLKLASDISENDFFECISRYTHLLPTIITEYKTVYIFWLIQRPNEDSTRSIEEALKNLQISDVKPCHDEQCELVAFIVHL